MVSHYERGYGHVIHTTVIFMSLLIGVAAPALSRGATAAKVDPSVENKEVELESIRTRIKDVKSNIKTAKGDAESILKDIQQTEKAASVASARLQELETDIRDKTAELKGLEQRRKKRQVRLKTERDLLSELIRVAFQNGHDDFLKLLLNQEDPSKLSRMVAYHDYFGRARARSIDEVLASINDIESLENSIKSERAQLQSLRTQQVAKLEEFDAYRKSRKGLITGLESYIADQDKKLQLLQRNEKDLADLLNKLEQEQTAIQVFEELTPFNELKGKLKWPVKGHLVSHFGAERKGGKLRWHGVKIAAVQGEEVHAVSTGKVIFADWFRNLGLLMIVDHGDGYMSLYGNNEILLKKPGDIVKTGEVIARVGDTGGQGRAGLYFEIRQQGNPLDPGIWCRG